jgi:colanic acid/amylovoran biosynthesis glycosyltransferase
MIVLHLIRKKSQLRSSFIKNQISAYEKYNPVIGYLTDKSGTVFDGGYSHYEDCKIETHQLSTFKSKRDNFIYKYLLGSGREGRKSLLKLIERIRPDVIHLHYGSDAGIFLPAIRNSGIPKIVSFYGYDCSSFPRTYFGLGTAYLRTRVFNIADAVLAMSPDMYNDLISIGCPEHKLRVHYHGVPVKKWITSRDLLKNNEVINFLIVAGLVPKKGHLFLLEAFFRAVKSNKNIRLNIVGEGDLRNRIERGIIEMNMQDYIELSGPVQYGSEAHIAIMQGGDVFIHPSITDREGDKEGIPGSIVEAMAAGMPVISTRHGGIPFVIENNFSGLLVEEHDVNGLAEAILRLSLSHQERREMGLRAADYANSNLDIEKKAQEREIIYSTFAEKS